MSESTTPRLNEKRGVTFLDLPAPLFLVFAVLLWVSFGFGWIPPTSLSLFVFLLSIALPLTWLGNKTPFLGKYLGFGALLTIFGPPFLVNLGYITPDMQASIKSLCNDVLIPLNIGLLLSGSILGKLDRKVLLRSFLLYLPVIVLSMAATVAVVFLACPLLGYSSFEGLVLTAFPCFAGGSGGPLLSIPAMLNEIGMDGGTFIALMMAALTLSNVEAIVFSALLDSLGKVKPSWTGNGKLLRKGVFDASAGAAKFDGKIGSLHAGFFVAAALFALSQVIATLLKPIINLNYIVWLIVLCLILKMLNVIPKEVEEKIAWASDHTVGLVLPAMMVGLGISMIDLVSLGQALNFRFFLLVTIVVLAYTVFSMLFGRLFGFYPVEAGISVGCCSCNIGGTGDLICCQVAHRLDLYPFASISTRIGGALALVVLGLILPLVA